ncbi:MAG: T9SS type A sorting domain-containing protein [Ginsengibacter sp.]
MLETPSHLLEYTIYDVRPLTGINYYKLQQVEYDGLLKNLGIRMIRYSKPGFGNLKIYLNPVGNFATIQFEPRIFNQIQILDNSGRVLKTEKINLLQTEFKIQTLQLPKGIYLIKISGAEISEVQKIIKE